MLDRKDIVHKATFNASEVCAIGDTLYSCGCKNPYRAILTATARDLNPREIENAYVRKSRGETLNDLERMLLSQFDAIVKESTKAIDSLSPD